MLVILCLFFLSAFFLQKIDGIHQPQLKMTIPAILIVLVLALLVLILNGMYLCVRRIAKLSK